MPKSYHSERAKLLKEARRQIAYINSRECWRMAESELAKAQVWEEYHKKKRRLKRKFGIPMEVGK